MCFFSNFKYMSIFIHTAYIKRYRNTNYNIFLIRSNYNCYKFIYITLRLHTSMQRKRCTYRIPKSALLFKKINLTCKTKQTMHKMK